MSDKKVQLVKATLTGRVAFGGKKTGDVDVPAERVGHLVSIGAIYPIEEKKAEPKKKPEPTKTDTETK